MLEIYRSASADEPAGQDRTIQAMSGACQNGSTPEGIKRCIELLKQAQSEAEGKGHSTDSNSGLEDGAGQVGEAEIEAQAAPVVSSARLLPSHATHLRHPEALNPDYIRSSSNEVRVLFPRLPNPDIAIFVFPHLATANNVPVPGYSTVMPLYDSVQYAMPGERRTIDGME